MRVSFCAISREIPRFLDCQWPGDIGAARLAVCHSPCARHLHHGLGTRKRIAMANSSTQMPAITIHAGVRSDSC